MLAAAIVALGVGGGCGNYSNEDLEFMSALPQRDDVSADIPTQSSLEPADRAELYRTTREAITAFNGLVDKLLGLIDVIRASSPTSRLPDERIWGPFAADMHPGWDARMVVDRAPDQTTFSYHIDFRRNATLTDPGTNWLTLLSGSYAASGGVRKGAGSLDITTADLRAQSFDTGFAMLDQMHIEYNTSTFPVTVTLTFTNLPDPTDPTAAMQGKYAYSAQANGQGALEYDIWADVIAGPGGVEKFQVTSQWLPTGEGRADVAIVEGDAVGLQQTECWDRRFHAVYNDKPWSTSEDVPGIPPGDPADFCPVIPAL